MSNKTAQPQHYVVGDDIEVSDGDLKPCTSMANDSPMNALHEWPKNNLIPWGNSPSGGSKHSLIVQTPRARCHAREAADDRR